ncbi:MAG: hypothetical protein M3R38_29225 [Actinomycetota bacterium]|nr:hypothetical protein [Actinomycetota bacterium]MDP9486920.1 hypothetical protein [Actinomycetota bacterium]
MLTLSEICGFCRRGVQAWEWMIFLLTYEEKRVAEATFRVSVTEGVCCAYCVSED